MKFFIVTFALLVSTSAYPNEVTNVKHGHGHGHHHNQQEWEVPIEFVTFTDTTTTTTTTTVTTAAPTTPAASADPDVKPTIVEPSKFDNIINVTWSPNWNPASYFNFSNFQGNVQEKLVSLANLPFSTDVQSNSTVNINIGTTGTSTGTTTGTTTGTIIGTTTGTSQTAVAQDVSNSLTSLVTVITNYLTGLTNVVNVDGLVTAATETVTSLASSTSTALTAAYNTLGLVIFPATIVGVFVVGMYMIIYMIVQMIGFVLASKVSILQAIVQALTGSENVFAQKFGGFNQSQRFRRNPDLPTPQVLLDLASKVYKALEKYTQ